MYKKARERKCRICGKIGKLSFEHVPPKSAFNNTPLAQAKGSELMQTIKAHDYENIKTSISQRGSGDHTLYEKCNNNNERRYGNACADWTWQGASILKLANGIPKLQYQYRIFPLMVVKQIICMFLSTNPPEFRDNFPYLEKFVLSSEEKYLNDWKEFSLKIPPYKIYTWYPGDLSNRKEIINKAANYLLNQTNGVWKF